MKQEKKVYLESETLERLRKKALEVSIEGRGWLTHYLERIAKEKIIIIDSNVKNAMSLFDLEEKKNLNKK